MSFSSASVTTEEAGGSETDFTVDVTEIRIDAVYQMLFEAEQKIVPYFSAGVGQMVFDAGEESNVQDEPATNLTYGGGLKIFFTPRLALRLDARDNVALIDKPFASESGIPTPNTKTFQANNPEFQAGLTIGFGGSDEGFGIRDTDFDGVPDKDDLCPNTPRGVIVDETGCPVDSDGDGVPDGLDACPNTPAGATVDERGCPMDSDNDGVYDNEGYRLRGHQFADEEGRFALETIVPGLYTGRTRHIHVKAQGPGGPILTTQLYFPGEPDNERDMIFNPALLMDVQDSDEGQLAFFTFVVPPTQ